MQARWHRLLRNHGHPQLCCTLPPAPYPKAYLQSLSLLVAACLAELTSLVPKLSGSNGAACRPDELGYYETKLVVIQVGGVAVIPNGQCCHLMHLSKSCTSNMNMWKSSAVHSAVCAHHTCRRGSFSLNQTLKPFYDVPPLPEPLHLAPRAHTHTHPPHGPCWARCACAGHPQAPAVRSYIAVSRAQAAAGSSPPGSRQTHCSTAGAG